MSQVITAKTLPEDAGNDPAADPARSTAERLAAITQERDELQKIFDLQWDAQKRTIARWQAATGKHTTWPDHADLLVWLLEQLEASAPARAASQPGSPDGCDFEAGKTYPTRDGREAFIYCTDAPGCRPIHGRIGGMAASWDKNGRNFYKSPMNIDILLPALDRAPMTGSA